ncbi:MAG: tRNA guanosine(34) transglycosylase Tgt [Eubacteriaceae bacterium]|jgi:queuine tRNA-ribosyltransferase|nr:tRNA guanosine(34) transglycosylase Tgt [Eubacteriaceae bacterium]
MTNMACSLSFCLDGEDPSSSARAATLATARGEIRTPAFMPVGTMATVKGLLPEQLAEMGAEIVLSNTYHLSLRPGEAIVRDIGGLHSFMHWAKPILTDSGGFQVFSLAKINKISDDGVDFQSHIDGSRRFISPEASMQIQRDLGADIVMAFDECAPAGVSYAYAGEALHRTLQWLKRSAECPIGEGQSLFGIVQGGMFEGLRKRAVEETCAYDLPGFSIGGLSVGESKDEMFSLLGYTAPMLPRNKPRYLMGVGSFDALVEGVRSGVDMFDCVMQTRMGRTGAALVRTGRLNLRNAAFQRDKGPIAQDCGCYVCKNYSRAYLRHLVVSGEILASVLISWHNIAYTIAFMREMRSAILEKRFARFAQTFWSGWGKGQEA